MSDDPKMTPEEHAMLADAPADAAVLPDDDEERTDPPEGVVGDDDRP